MNEIDVIIRILEDAIKAGECMLPKQPRRWLAKHGGECCSTANIWGKPTDRQRVRSLTVIYTAMVNEAKSLVKPIIYTEW